MAQHDGTKTIPDHAPVQHTLESESLIDTFIPVINMSCYPNMYPSQYPVRRYPSYPATRATYQPRPNMTYVRTMNRKAQSTFHHRHHHHRYSQPQLTYRPRSTYYARSTYRPAVPANSPSSNTNTIPKVQDNQSTAHLSLSLLTQLLSDRQRQQDSDQQSTTTDSTSNSRPTTFPQSQQALESSSRIPLELLSSAIQSQLQSRQPTQQPTLPRQVSRA